MLVVKDWIDFLKKEIDEKYISGIKFYAKKIFMNGNCGNLFTFLHMIAKKYKVKATPYRIWNGNEPMHIVTEISGKYYDINGEYSSIEECLDNYFENITNRNEYKRENFQMSKASLDEVNEQSNGYGYEEYDGFDVDDTEYKIVRSLMLELEEKILKKVKPEPEGDYGER